MLAGIIIKNPKQNAANIVSVNFLGLFENTTKSAINIGGRMVRLDIKSM